MSAPFTDHRAAARELLTIPALSEREGQFVGGLCYRAQDLTEKQANWLRILLERHGLPPFVGTASNG
ncbi:hypothetical protein [Novosphingobium sp.]|uniref:hypothetical protein n=1 Tax=Novosphingobium sp. TaxID=1874826 RepID=UPI00261A328D|nr:hypothetical protein [Novosphingobium sp.]